jgi:hypothetical protein
VYCYLRGWVRLDLASHLGHWLLKPIPIPAWCVIVFSLVFAVAVGFLSRAWFLLKSQGIPFSAVKTEKWRNYTSDVIEDVTWEWKYRLDLHSPVTLHLTAFCAKEECKCRLKVSEEYIKPPVGYPIARASVKCPHCPFYKRFDCTQEELFQRVNLEIERRIRTGAFIQRLGKK